MACVAVNSLVRTIELEFLQPRPRPILQEKQLISSNKHLIQSLHQELQLLMDVFDETRMDGVEAIKDLEKQLKDVAFRAEDEIELLVVQLHEKKRENEEFREDEEFGIASLFGEKPQEKQHGDTDAGKTWSGLKLHHILQKAIDDIDGIKEELVKMKMEYKKEGRKTTLDAFPNSDDVVIKKGDSDSHSGNKMVGKEDEFDTIMKMLTQHPSKKREVVTIKGMGGIGKTTLARRVYEDPLVTTRFDERAWVVASQNHSKTNMLIGLLESMGKAESGNDEKLANRIYQGLKRRRYLIVMDDVWSTKAWDDVQACFPDDGNGSRVLLTTRLAKVSSSSNDFSHQMQLLDQSESWNLFCEKACRYGDVEFERIVGPIVEKCRGLPLAIIVVAGLFSKLNTLNEWRNITDTLISYATTTIDEECSRILSLSYTHLPHNLKACFLYLGVFPEDAKVKASELARLWAAEGLVKAFKDESFDAVAERHIRELMDRNLIIASERSSCGRKIKAFMMHDLLHAFCVSEAQKESLLLVAHENNRFDLPQKCFRWVSIQLEDFDIPSSYSSLKRCRSIFFYRQKHMSIHLEGFKLLRVIYYPYSYFNDDDFIHVEIEDIVHMRWLCHVIISDLSKFVDAWNLQTISTYNCNAWNYLESPQLHYFHFSLNSRVSTTTCPSKFVHKNLQSISWLQPILCTEEFFTNIPYLKKVKIHCEIKDCNDCIESLAYLQQLESLNISATGRNLHTVPINNNIFLLKNLKKLRFNDTGFKWKEINVLCKLTRLEVLELHNACVGEEWELPEDENFCQLIFLEIDICDLKHWKARGDHFQKLERLLLYSCKKLKEIPAEFADIPTLKSIELYNCLPSAVTSAKQIEEEQRDYGNDDMIVANHTGPLPELMKVSVMKMSHLIGGGAGRVNYLS